MAAFNFQHFLEKMKEKSAFGAYENRANFECGGVCVVTVSETVRLLSSICPVPPRPSRPVVCSGRCD